MSELRTVTGTQLTNALFVLGVKFIMGGSYDDGVLHKNPVRLIVGLAESADARLRLSLIPLFLEHPEFSIYVPIALEKASGSARLTLQCYYSASVWLQKIHFEKLNSLKNTITPLSDLFSKDLNMKPEDDPEINLVLLAKRHRELSHVQINWLGTYKHAAQVWMRGLELQNV
ncbi:MAG: hypothetical protein ABI904_06445 [Chloroflexota bacterium]